MTVFEHITVPFDAVAHEPELASLLALSSARHKHLCPRQILGVRMGLAGAAALGMTVPRQDKKMLIIAETDGCLLSGIEAATGLSVNRRTLRIVDYGKIAATFVDVQMETAVRVAPRLEIREQARAYAPQEKRRYFAMLRGYQVMPDAALLSLTAVRLTPAVRELVSRPGVRTDCQQCGEEIINEREQVVNGRVLCIPCAGRAYYRCAD